MTTLFRPHRSTLTESMKEAIPVSCLEQLRSWLLASSSFPINSTSQIELSPACWDDRIEWDTYVVTIDGQGVGFTNGPLE